MSSCSNYSAVSGEANAIFGDSSASSSDITASFGDAVAASSSETAVAFSGDVVAAGSDNAKTSGVTIINGPPQSDVVSEVVKNKVEFVVVSHVNSPSDFYVQLRANLAVKDMVDTEINNHVKSELGAVPVDHVEIGKLALG